MYAILISFALAIYTIVLVDFSFFYKEISANNDLLSSAQALYTAEGAVESAVSVLGHQDQTVRNIIFSKESKNAENQTREEFLDYQEGINTAYLQRNLTLNHSALTPTFTGPSSHYALRAKNSALKVGDPFPLQNNFVGLESNSARGFMLREIPPEQNFNELHFDFDQGEENSDLVFDIFVFPKAGQLLDFKDFQTLKNEPDSNSIKRISLNTRDGSSVGSVAEGDFPLHFEVQNNNKSYKKSLFISGFQPLENNYFLHFQTLDNQTIHYQLTSFFQGKSVVLPALMQTLDVVGATSTGLYHRVKFQREAEEGIMPGLNFVHFSDASIVK